VGRQAVRSWAFLRRSIYETLTFDPPTAAAQAVLSDALALALRSGLLNEHDWPLTDEQLLEVLRADNRTRDTINREYLGRLANLVFTLQLSGSLQALGLVSRSHAKEVVESVVCEVAKTDKILVYVTTDGGMFERRLMFVDPITMDSWS